MTIGPGQIATTFMGLFAIMNPIANTPVFLGLTADDDTRTRRAVARKALILAFIIVAIFCVAGKAIFDLFGITLPAFRITGGLMVFVIGFQMLHGKQSEAHQPTTDSAEPSPQNRLGVAISPLAVPILAGPGTIATAMNFSATGGLEGIAVTIVAFFVLCFMTYGLFLSGERMVAYLGNNGLKVVTQMMGLILAVIGTQMTIDGIAGAIAAFSTQP